MVIQYLYHIHPPIPFPYILPPHILVQTPRQDRFASLFSIFEKKRDIFICLR
jgi:hypothetical protein